MSTFKQLITFEFENLSIREVTKAYGFLHLEPKNTNTI